MAGVHHAWLVSTMAQIECLVDSWLVSTNAWLVSTMRGWCPPWLKQNAWWARGS